MNLFLPALNLLLNRFKYITNKTALNTLLFFLPKFNLINAFLAFSNKNFLTSCFFIIPFFKSSSKYVYYYYLFWIIYRLSKTGVYNTRFLWTTSSRQWPEIYYFFYLWCSFICLKLYFFFLRCKKEWWKEDSFENYYLSLDFSGSFIFTSFSIIFLFVMFL